MTIRQLATKCGCSIQWVYRIAKKLGRMPTYEEMMAKKGKCGRPTKYKEI